MLTVTSNESDRNLVQGFTARQIQQLAKTIYSLNNNGKRDTFISAAGLLAHNSSINFAFTKPWILDSGATNHFASDSQFFTHTCICSPHGCVLQDLDTGRMIGSGKQHVGLYYMYPH